MLQNIVYLKKTNIREGLIRARLFGANFATGQVIKWFKILLKKKQNVLKTSKISIFQKVLFTLCLTFFI